MATIWPVRLRSKYHAEPITIDGRRFASKLEARRYGELRLLERVGQVAHLRCQVAYPLAAWTARDAVSVSHYIADFVYDELEPSGVWREVVEDCKGVRTPLYRLKARWMRAQYGIQIRETTRR